MKLSRSKTLDAILLGLSFLFFGAFAYRTLTGGVVDARGRMPLGHLKKGVIERKQSSGYSFKRELPEAPLFHKDAIWSGDETDAELELDDGTEIRMTPKTFLILRKSLRGGNERKNIEVVQGKIEAKPSRRTSQESVTEVSTGGKTYSVSATTSGFVLSALEDAKTLVPIHEEKKLPSTSPSPSPSELLSAQLSAPLPVPLTEPYPTPDLIFYVAEKKEVPIPFTWERPSKGTLIVKKVDTVSKKKQEILRTQLQGQSNYRATLPVLPVGHHYDWHIESADSPTPHGEIPFQILPMSVDTLQKIMKEDKEKDKKIEIIY